MHKNIIRCVFLLIFTLTLISCARADFEPATFAPDAAVFDMAPTLPGQALFEFDDAFYFMAEVMAEEGLAGSEPQAPMQRLIIQTATTLLETESFDDAVSGLRYIPNALNGYTRSERLFTVNRQRRFEIVIRVPAADFEAALWHIEQIATTRSLNISAEDVTDRFYDMSGRLATRLIEEERILVLIEQTTTLRELLDLESRLAATRLQIERYRASLADLASRITYSTIYVHLFDVEETHEAVAVATFGEQVGGAFGASIDGTISVIQSIIVFLAGAVIPLAIISPLIIIFVYRRRKNKALALTESG